MEPAYEVRPRLRVSVEPEVVVEAEEDPPPVLLPPAPALPRLPVMLPPAARRLSRRLEARQALQNLRHLTFWVETHSPGPWGQLVKPGHLQWGPSLHPDEWRGLGQVLGRPGLGRDRFFFRLVDSLLEVRSVLRLPVRRAFSLLGVRPAAPEARARASFLVLRLEARQALQNLRHFTFWVETQPPGPCEQ